MMKQHHSISKTVYYQVFAALMVLLAATVGVRFIDLGGFLNVVAALVIAIAKTLLIILYFMHVRINSRLTQIFVGASFFWLLILIAFTMSDYLARDWPPASGPLP